MEIIDSHCHLDDSSFAADFEQMLGRAEKAGVSTLVVPAIQASGWAALQQLCQRFPQLHPAYGLHPMFMPHHREQDLTALSRQLAQGRAIAVGECGLDFYIPKPDKQRQQQFFEAQLELAQQYRLPVIIHARKAVEQVVLTLRRYPGLTGVLHSFSGSRQQAERLIDMGFLMSFGGPATYANAHRLHKLIAWMPPNSFLLETDSPDQPTATHRGERNEPAYLPEILHAISSLKGIPAERLAEETTANARRLFNLPATSIR
ncbi:TatD family hydrolase [Sedimenticola sp.]|uniref:TatD family hydrolase n=1 Tax=Sedimenticola sp. TaxID=1940285 RepID=UPI002587DAF6|nr:TatD family hydrolase [Sedimenticola sp.]MCW8903335.1 TatD family hydrolase [Sedimenticola sp.]